MTKRVPEEGAPGTVVGLLHEEARDSSRMNLNKSNREGIEKREPVSFGSAADPEAILTTSRGHSCSLLTV
jgi:hypothetical protein